MKDNTFGKNLKKLRVHKGYTQLQIAEKLNISPSSIGMYEQGRREPDLDTILLICNMFKISVNYMFGIDKNINNMELEEIINDFTEKLYMQKDLIHKGNKLNLEEKEKLVDFIKMASILALNFK